MTGTGFTPTQISTGLRAVVVFGSAFTDHSHLVAACKKFAIVNINRASLGEPSICNPSLNPPKGCIDAIALCELMPASFNDASIWDANCAASASRVYDPTVTRRGNRLIGNGLQSLDSSSWSARLRLRGAILSSSCALARFASATSSCNAAAPCRNVAASLSNFPACLAALLASFRAVPACRLASLANLSDLRACFVDSTICKSASSSLRSLYGSAIISRPIATANQNHEFNSRRDFKENPLYLGNVAFHDHLRRWISQTCCSQPILNLLLPISFMSRRSRRLLRQRRKEVRTARQKSGSL